jgi:hypothetical protein
MEKKHNTVGVCYRPPDNKKVQDEALFKMIGLVSKEKLLMMGDFNFADLHWENPESLDDNHLFMKCINDNFLIQCVEMVQGVRMFWIWFLHQKKIWLKICV